MHAILTSIGTDGDVLPYVGLGDALRRRGHRVTLAASDGYARLAAEHGLEFAPLLTQAEIDELLHDPDFWHPLKGPRLAAGWGAPHMMRHYRVLESLCDGSRDAVLVASPGILPARVLEDRRSVPLVSIVLQPWMIRSDRVPPIMPARFMTLPRWAPWPVAPLYWRMVDAIGWAIVGRQLNRMRGQLGLPPVPRLFQWWLSPRCVIGLFPDWYGPPQPDWPAQVRLAGFPRPENGAGAGEGEPAPNAEDDRPIAFTFGTGMLHATRVFAACADACQILGRRGLFLTRHPAQLPSPLPHCVTHVNYAPFASLFPKCAAVVHHGGVGTTAAALAAGAPQLVLPFAFDQFDNAARVMRLGVGAAVRGRSRHSARAVAAALADLLTPEARARCRRVAECCAADGDGLACAAGWIEEFADSHLPQGVA